MNSAYWDKYFQNGVLDKKVPLEKIKKFDEEGYFNPENNPIPLKTYRDIYRYIKREGFVITRLIPYPEMGNRWFEVHHTGPGYLWGGLQGTPEMILEHLLELRLHILKRERENRKPNDAVDREEKNCCNELIKRVGRFLKRLNLLK